RNGGGFKRHLAAAMLDQQDLEQVAMAVRTDGPVMNRGARGDRFDMNEIERLIIRRIAVEMKQRQRGSGHDEIIGQCGAGENIDNGGATPPCTSINPKKMTPP